MTLQPLDAQAFAQLKKKDPKYYTGRWPYLQLAVDMATEVPVERVLELGPYRRPLFLGSDIMDRKNHLAAGKVDLIHDASVTPWPITGDKYDLFVALQVWEHLGVAQDRAFEEVRRIAKRAVLSFPFEWQLQNKQDCHHNITEQNISRWTLGIKPERRTIVNRPDDRFKRMVCLYVFD